MPCQCELACGCHATDVLTGKDRKEGHDWLLHQRWKYITIIPVCVCIWSVLLTSLWDAASSDILTRKD